MQAVLSALRTGHWPSLIAAWIHFEVSFMVWLLVGALGVSIADEFHLTPTEKGFMVAVPLLSGAIMRVFVGACSDRYGSKATGLVVLLGELLAVLWGWAAADTYGQVLGLGFALGVAGASFAVALPLASRVYPPAHQGLAMGVAASANSGTVLAAFFAPRLAEMVGWHGVFGVMVAPVLFAFVLFAALVRENDVRPPRDHARWLSDGFDMLRRPSVYWLCFMYAVTFGGFVGFSSFLPIFFHDEYGLDLVTAGTMTAMCGLAGSAIRPAGGYAADRLEGLRMLVVIFPLIAILIAVVAFLRHDGAAVPAMVAAVAVMGFGNGVVFQVVSNRFQKQMGMASGIIGAAGGIGGFLLPVWLGVLKDLSGSYRAGLLVFAGVSLGAALCVEVARRRARRGFNVLSERGVHH